jgi:hypothetical protein
MHVKRFDDQRLVIVDFPFWIGLICFPLSFLFLCLFLAHLLNGERRIQDWFTSLFGFSITFACAAVFTKRSVFDFDLASRQLSWHRRGIFGRRSGQVPFSDIRSVNVECCASSRQRRLCYRVALHAATTTIPLTESYSSGQNKHCNSVRAQIARALGTDIPNVDDDILALALAGRTRDAALFAGAHYDLDDSKAKRFVDDLVRQSA